MAHRLVDTEHLLGDMEVVEDLDMEHLLGDMEEVVDLDMEHLPVDMVLPLEVTEEAVEDQDMLHRLVAMELHLVCY